MGLKTKVYYIESLWTGDTVVKGNSKAVNNRYSEEIGNKRTTKNTFIFRPTQGDVYVDSQGNKQTGKKVVNEKKISLRKN